MFKRFLLLNADDKIVGAGSEDSMYSEAKILNKRGGYLDEFDHVALHEPDRFLDGYIVVEDTPAIRRAYS